jgi:hypothetical protein
MPNVVLGLTTPLSTMDWSTLDFNGIYNGFITVVPYVIPVIVAFIAFKKGYQFLKKQVKGA